MEQHLLEVLGAIREPDAAAMEAARTRQARLAKPPHSLGALEDISVKLAGITGQVGSRMEKRRLLVFAADNGIVREGVSSCPSSVTLRQTLNLSRGLTGAAVLAKHFRAQLEVIDVGVDADIDAPGVVNRKISRGTRSFADRPAMAREDALRAIEVGVEAARRAREDGIDILGVGEMGIGNTTTSAAVLSALLGLPARETASRGAGLTDAGLQKKLDVIDGALARLKPDPNDPVDALSKVGGLDLAAMCGAFIGAASLRLPAVIDGFISAVAALCAVRLSPLCAAYLFPSHASAERGYALAMREMELSPMLELNMRLGEGSGCPIAFEVIDAAQRVICEMGTFEEAGIDDGYLAEIRGNRRYMGEA